MVEWLKRMLFDETAFIGAARGLLLGAGGLVVANPEVVNFLPPWAGAILLGLGGAMRSSSHTK